MQKVIKNAIEILEAHEVDWVESFSKEHILSAECNVV